MSEVKRREFQKLSLTYKAHFLRDDLEKMTITEWPNEEGVDVTIDGSMDRQFSLSDAQIRALQILITNRRFV